MYPYPTLAQFKRRDGNMTTAVEATQDRENILEPDSSRPSSWANLAPCFCLCFVYITVFFAKLYIVLT